MTPPWNETKFTTALACLRRAHPARVGAADIKAAMLEAGLEYSVRSIQRQMYRFSDAGLVYRDQEGTIGWRLTSAGCGLLGLSENDL